MTSARFSLSLVGVVGVFAAILAAAALWLIASDPVKVATGVEAATKGDVSPIVKALAGVLYDALQGIILVGALLLNVVALRRFEF